MNTIDVGHLFQLSFNLARHQMFRLQMKLSAGIPFEAQDVLLRDASIRDTLADFLDLLRRACADARLPVSRSVVEKFLSALRTGPIALADAESRYEQIHSAMRNELSQRTFVLIEDSKVRYYAAPRDGWDDITSAFPSCVTDIDEASLCLALGRPTASVFHMMRVVEAGLKALAASLDVAYEFKNWDPVLRKLAYIGETDYKRLEERWKGQRQRFLEARDRLSAIKDAVRNPTMHARGDYTESVAEDVYRAVRRFMSDLSSWLEE